MAKTSKQGRMAIVSHEAIVQTRYLDSVRVWTIGIGHTAAAGGLDPRDFKGALTVAQVLNLFDEDLPKYEADVSRLVKVPLRQYQFDALVSFHFNTGKLGKSTLLRRVNAGDFKGAEREFDKWHIPASVKGRRDSEKLLFGEGIYPAPFANIYPATAAGKILWGKGRRIDLRPFFDEVQVPTTTPAPTPAIDTHSQTTVEPVKMTPAKVEQSTKITKTGTASIISLITAAVAAAWAYFVG